MFEFISPFWSVCECECVCECVCVCVNVCVCVCVYPTPDFYRLQYEKQGEKDCK